MIHLRNSYVKFENGNTTEDITGSKPCVIFSHEGSNVAIYLTQFVDGGQAMRFDFSEGILLPSGKIVPYKHRPVFAQKETFVELFTHQVVSYEEAHNEDGTLKDGFIDEFTFYVESFGKSANAGVSIYEKVQMFITSKLSDGL